MKEPDPFTLSLFIFFSSARKHSGILSFAMMRDCRIQNA
jgi:hypothetical protein